MPVTLLRLHLPRRTGVGIEQLAAHSGLVVHDHPRWQIGQPDPTHEADESEDQGSGQQLGQLSFGRDRPEAEHHVVSTVDHRRGDVRDEREDRRLDQSDDERADHQARSRPTAVTRARTRARTGSIGTAPPPTDRV